MITSAHGELLGDHWPRGKETFIPGVFRVPLPSCEPRAEGGHGRMVRVWSGNIDLMPTILDRWASPIPLQCDGRSLSVFLTGDQERSAGESAFFAIAFRDGERAGGARLGRGGEEAVSFADGRAYLRFAAFVAMRVDPKSDPVWTRNPVHHAADRGSPVPGTRWRWCVGVWSRSGFSDAASRRAQRAGARTRCPSRLPPSSGNSRRDRAPRSDHKPVCGPCTHSGRAG